MDRRAFLSLIAAGLSAEAADRLLWVPKTMITVPALPAPVGLAWDKDAVSFMAKALADRIDQDALERLYRPGVGDTIAIRAPARFDVLYGWVSKSPGNIPFKFTLPEVDPKTMQVTGRRKAVRFRFTDDVIGTMGKGGDFAVRVQNG